MPAVQPRLFPDPQPLVERLGRDFFRQLPEQPGVYLMRDEQDAILYVGKARNLRHRLGSYRVANPERMARRTLRLLRRVARIELELCADEAAALKRESELLLALKPRFNRAGVWEGPKRFLVWRITTDALEITVTETPESGWHQLGPMGSQVHWLRRVTARLLWLRLHPGQDLTTLPAGWARGALPELITLHCASHRTPDLAPAGEWTQQLLTGDVKGWKQWLDADSALCTFTRQWLAEDLEQLAELAGTPDQS